LLEMKTQWRKTRTVAELEHQIGRTSHANLFLESMNII
jgi:hypothetical protein